MHHGRQHQFLGGSPQPTNIDVLIGDAFPDEGDDLLVRLLERLKNLVPRVQVLQRVEILADILRKLLGVDDLRGRPFAGAGELDLATDPGNGFSLPLKTCIGRTDIIHALDIERWLDPFDHIHRIGGFIDEHRIDASQCPQRLGSLRCIEMRPAQSLVDVAVAGHRDRQKVAELPASCKCWM